MKKPLINVEDIKEQTLKFVEEFPNTKFEDKFAELIIAETMRQVNKNLSGEDQQLRRHAQSNYSVRCNQDPSYKEKVSFLEFYENYLVEHRKQLDKRKQSNISTQRFTGARTAPSLFEKIEKDSKFNFDLKNRLNDDTGDLTMSNRTGKGNIRGPRRGS